jgi:hypothetical protein
MSETDIDNGTDGGSTRTPAYVSFATLQTLLKALKTDGVPPQIDRSVLNKFSGGVQGQMKMALRSLDLMDGDIPTDHLRKLVEAYETPAFDDLLAERLRASYPYVFKLDLMTATPTMFADAFKNATNAKEDVLRKCRTFFLHAAKKANIPMGNRLASGSVPRSPNGAGRRKSKAKSTPETELQDKQQNKADQQPISDKAMEYKLVDLMKESDIEDAERNAIWTLIQYLTKKGKTPQ